MAGQVPKAGIRPQDVPGELVTEFTYAFALRQLFDVAEQLDQSVPVVREGLAAALTKWEEGSPAPAPLDMDMVRGALEVHECRWGYCAHENETVPAALGYLGFRVEPARVTRVLQSCECGELRVLTLAGHWGEAQLRAREVSVSGGS